ncbi:MAG: signal peptidase II [Lachnospiraceae bacterium]|nr:signal peptidase II [Lachnospiraceae bacterium]
MKTSSKSKVLGLFLDILFFILLVILDQITKNLAVVYLKDKPAYVIWDGVFELHYLENSGAAFGMLQNQKILFVSIAAVILVIIGYVLVKLPRNRHFVFLEALLVLIASGAVGNMIDRVQFNYVVDFFYFKLIDFPIFNVADIYVSVSCVLLAILVLFFYKDEDFDFLGKKKE